MDMTGTKRRIPKLFNTDNVYLHTTGDGATAGRCCRLCGGDTNLRSFSGTYLWEGVEERYDQMLFDCFRIRVSPSDGLICDWCVRQLRCAARFKALVYAAFEKPLSSSTQLISSPLHGTQTQPNSDEVQAIDSKSIIEMLKTRMADNDNNQTRRLYDRKIFDSNLIVRRINIECKVCKQKYPMLTPYGGGKGFICSLCTNNEGMDRFCKKCNVVVPAETMQKHMKSHLKADLRRKRRQFSLSQKTSRLKRQQEGCLTSGNLPKYKCKICPKKYVTSEHLAEHLKCQHRDKNICNLCKKDLKNKDMLVQHMKMHRNHVSMNNYLPGPAMLAGKTKRDGKKRSLRRTKRSI